MGIVQKWVAGVAGFLVLALLVGLVAVVGYQSLQIQGLRKAFADIQLSEPVRKAAEEAERTGQPGTVEFDLRPLLETIAGLNAEIFRLKVQIEREKNPPPGKPAGTVVTAPPITLPNQASAEIAAAQADQRVNFRGMIRSGTLIYACEVALEGGVCPAGRERSLPLSRAITFDGTLARVAPGVFAAINVVDSPFAVTEVKTTTRVIEVKIEMPRIRAEYFGATGMAFVAGGQLFAFGGATYENFLSGGLYKIGAGASYNSALGGVTVPTYMVGFTKTFF